MGGADDLENFCGLRTGVGGDGDCCRSFDAVQTEDDRVLRVESASREDEQQAKKRDQENG